MYERAIRAIGGIETLCAKDYQSLVTAERELLAEMSGGDWYTRDDICRITGQEEGMRRMRALRRHYEIEKRRIEGVRAWEYRIVRKLPEPVEVQRDLF